MAYYTQKTRCCAIIGAMRFTSMIALADRIDRLTTGIGRAVAWLALAVVLLQFALVVARYLFGLGSIWLTETVIYAHATLFMLAAAWTLKAGGHVRVDVFYAEASPRTRAKIDLIGALLLLLPFALVLLWLAWPYAARSWAILERSQETSGLPLVFALKTLIPLFALMMALQGIAQAIRAVILLIPPPLAGEGGRRSRPGGGA
jgi:TRAP-type mannitol/chloroaromatic compound transport system permease small subunit